MLRVLCLGSRPESVQCLEYLLKEVENISVVGAVPHFAPQTERTIKNYKNLIRQHQIPEIKFNKIRDLDYDLGLSFLFDRKIEPTDVDHPKLGFVNIHLGPLPRFRGSYSIAYAIKRARLDNNYKFGVTLHYMDHDLDTGPIIDLFEVPIFEDDSAYLLYIRALEVVLPVFKRNIHQIVQSGKKVKAVPQDCSIKSFFYSKGQLEHEVDLAGSPDQIYDDIRALTFPGKPKPFAVIGNYRVYLSLKDE